MFVITLLIAVVIALAAFFFYWVNYIGPEQIGMPIRHFGKSLKGGVIAFNGEAGWQANLLSPGRHLLIPFWETMQIHPWVRIPTGTYGIVISQIGEDLEPGERFVCYTPPKGKSLADVLFNPRLYLSSGGQKGPLLLVLPPDWRGPVHPGAFLVVTINGVFGNPVGPKQRLSVQEVLAGYGMTPKDLRVTQIKKGYYGSVESRIGNPPPAGSVATRPKKLQLQSHTPAEALKADLSRHNSYQNPHGFLEVGGYTGQQVDPLGTGVYTINRMVFEVKTGPSYELTEVAAGYVAVIKSRVSTFEPPKTEDQDKSTLVACGQIGVWETALGPGAYVLERSVLQAIRIPTHIIRGEVTRGSENSENGPESYQLKAIHADTVDNLEATVYYKVLVRISPENAPRFVITTGGVDNFFGSLLSALMSDLIRQTTQTMPAVEIVPNRQNIIKDVESGLGKVLATDYAVNLERFILGNVDLQKEIAEAVQDQAVQTQQVETQKARHQAEKARHQAEEEAGKADGAREREATRGLSDVLGSDGARQVLVSRAGQAPIPRVVVSTGIGESGAGTGATAGAILAETAEATKEEKPQAQSPEPEATE